MGKVTQGRWFESRWLIQSIAGWAHANLGNFEDMDVHDIAQYNLCEDSDQNHENFALLVEELEATQRWGDQYINEEIMVPRRDKMALGWVVSNENIAKVLCGQVLIGKITGPKENV